MRDLNRDESIPVDFITGFIDKLMLDRVFGNEEEKIASYYGVNALETLLDSYYDEVQKFGRKNIHNAIPIDWLMKKYPMNGVYGTEDYFRKVLFLYNVIKEWESEHEQ